MTIATVIIPTFGNAAFARWAIKSVQNQTVKDIEICIICDGSPSHMVSLFQNMGREDPRIKVFTYPKSLRTGEPYRDIVIKQTTGKIICYCSHDDLWLPNHVAIMEKTLRKYYFTHSIHAFINLPEAIKDENSILGGIYAITINPEIIKRMQGGENFFGLTFGAHTRKSYYKLQEGWVTTPLSDVPTDLYMWRKFLSAFEKYCQTTVKLTALNFRKIDRTDWSEQQRDDELKQYYEKIQAPEFLRQLNKNMSYLLTKVEWLEGFSEMERNEECTWRWCSSKGTMIINNHSNKNKLFTISATFTTGYFELSNLRIESAIFNENRIVNSTGCFFEKNIKIPPGKHVVKFSCDAKRVDAPADSRYLVFNTTNFHLVERK